MNVKIELTIWTGHKSMQTKHLQRESQELLLKTFSFSSSKLKEKWGTTVREQLLVSLINITCND